MARLYSYRDQTGVTVADERVADLIGSGDYSFIKGQEIFLIGPDNALYTVPAENARMALEAGYTYAPESEKEKKLLQQEIKDDPLSEVKAGAFGFARGLTFGLSDAALKGMGMTADEIRMYREENPISSTTGEIASFFVPYLGTGAAARAAGRGVQAFMKTKGAAGAARTPLIGGAAEKAFKSRPVLGAAGGAAEGITVGSMYAASDFILDEEINIPLAAEHIMAGAGWGAAAGGLLGGISSALAGGQKKLADAANFRYWKSLDPRNPELMLATQKLGYPERVEELGKFIRSLDKQGVIQNLGKHEEMWREISDDLLPAAGRDIGTIIKSITDKQKSLKGQIEDLMFDPVAVADEMREQILVKMLQKGVTNDPTMLKKIKRAEKAINAFEDLAYKNMHPVLKKIRAGKTLTFEESEAQKKIFQKFLANFNKNPRDADFYNVMAGIIRERSEDSLEAISQRLGEIKGIPLDLVQKFKETKKLYGNLATVQKILEGAIAREKRNNMFGLTDYIMGSALGGSTGVMVGAESLLSGGLAAAGMTAAGMIGRKYLRESGDLLAARMLGRMDDYGGMLNFATKSEEKIMKGINAISRGTAATMSDPTPPTPEKTISQFKTIRDDLNNLMGNPQALQPRLAAMVPESNGDQTMNQELIQTMANGIGYLHQNLPGNPLNDNMAVFQNDEPILPPFPDIIRFMRRVEIMNDPNRILMHVAAGTLMPEHLNTIQQVYPRLYQDQMRRLMESFMSRTPKLSPQIRNNLSRFFEFNMDPTLNFVPQLQEQYQQPPEQQQRRRGKIEAGPFMTMAQDAQVIGG